MLQSRLYSGCVKANCEPVLNAYIVWKFISFIICIEFCALLDDYLFSLLLQQCFGAALNWNEYKEWHKLAIDTEGKAAEAFF